MCVVFWLEKIKAGDRLEITVMNERIIFKWILKIYDQGRVMFITGKTRTRIFCCGNFWKI
jgi:hypothetical protein